MPAKLEQSASTTIIKGESFTARATFEEPTKTGSLILLILTAAGGLPVSEIPPVPGYTLLKTRGLRDIELTMWYRENAPSTTSVSVSIWGRTPRSLQFRAMEYSGVRQSGAFDKIITLADESRNIRSGSTGNITNADSLAIAVSVNQYTASQSGFTGGMIRLFENVTPSNKGRYQNEEWERSRTTIHQAITTAIQSLSFTGVLSTTRRWVCFLIVFKGGAGSGPVKLACTQTNSPICNQSGEGALSAFGPLRATAAFATKAQSSNPTAGKVARIAPFDYQYRLGGWSGFLIGSATVYQVESTEGLNGYGVRTSDSDLPRGDGAIRGIDLEGAREFQFVINVGKNREQIELFLDRLYRALVPRRDEDFEMIWKHPTQIPKMMRVRPIDLPRLRNAFTNQSYARQEFTMRAADPRHYSAVVQRVMVPNTPANAVTPTEVEVSNLGNIDAYPVITIQGPTTGLPVTSVQISNRSTLGTFKLELVLPTGSTVVADMEARVTGAPRSVITLDGEPRYGAWQLPREPFVISSDPTGLSGFNVLTMETIPAGAPIKVTLEYRHTWSG